MLRALLRGASDAHFLELRLITTASRVVQLFYQLQALRLMQWVVPALESWDGKANIYYGVTPRIRRRGTAADCGPAQAAWADFDRELPASLPLTPSMLINSSPGKHQALWRLDTPCPDLARIETINRAIAATTGADRNACDRARVLRLPGFRNLKYADRPRAKLLICDSKALYSPAELEGAFPAPPVAKPAIRTPQRPYAGGAAPDWLGLVFDAICRHLERAGHQLRPGREGGVTTTCPFHDDHNPSLSLHPERGWKCFAGCGQGRLTLLAARLGIRLTGRTGHGS